MDTMKFIDDFSVDYLSEPMPCPKCGHPHDCHSSNGQIPKAGDVSVCLWCAAILRYTMNKEEGMVFKLLDMPKLLELEKDNPGLLASVIKCRFVILSIIKKRNRNNK